MEFTNQELTAIKECVLEIAVRIGNEQGGFAGDASSDLIAPNTYELWEGAGYIVHLPQHTMCVMYGAEPMLQTFAHNDVAGITAWIREMDQWIMAQAE